MKKILLTALAWFVIAGSASAQHPCDSTFPNEQSVMPDAVYRLQVCAPAETYEARLAVDALFRSTEALRLVQGPNSKGLALFEGTADVRLPAGAHVLSGEIVVKDGARSIIQSIPALMVQAGASTPIPPLQTSAIGTMIPPATFIIDSLGRRWERRDADAAILVDGKQAAAGAAAEVLLWSDGIYAHTPTAAKDYWFKWSDATVDWVLAVDPRIVAPPPPPPPVTPPPVPPTPTPVVPFCSGVIAQAVKHLAKTDQIVITCDSRVTIAKGDKVVVTKR